MKRPQQGLSNRKAFTRGIVFLSLLVAGFVLFGAPRGGSGGGTASPPRTLNSAQASPQLAANLEEQTVPPRPELRSVYKPNEYRLQNKDRTPSDPLVTGDGFRQACGEYIYDETVVGRKGKPDSSTELAKMQKRFQSMPKGQPVFVQTHLLTYFMDNVHVPILQKRGNGFNYVLVTHNSDYSAPWEYGNTRGKTPPVPGKSFKDQRNLILDDPAGTVTMWFGQNLVMDHPRLRSIPIGIENRYNRYGQHVDAYLAMMKAAAPFSARRRWLFVNFNDKTNPHERIPARQAIQGAFKGAHKSKVTFEVMPTSHKKGGPGSREEILKTFLAVMGEHKFVLAPHGHGVDTHRLWEALYMGCVPITLRSAMDSTLFKPFYANSSSSATTSGGTAAVVKLSHASLSHSLPVLVVEDYKEVTPEWLEVKERELLVSFPLLRLGGGGIVSVPAGRGQAELVASPLSMAFWREEIHKYHSQ